MISNKLIGLALLIFGFLLIKSGINHCESDEWYYLNKYRDIVIGILFLFVGLFLLFISEVIF